MANIRPKDTPRVSIFSAGDTLMIDGDTTRSITARDALGIAEPVAVTGASAAVAAATQTIAVTRAAPSATALTLPAVATRNGAPLKIVDWSTSVTEHIITLTPDGTETIMQAATFPIASTSGQPGSVTLYPSTTLNGWYIAP